jgi:hypothetical protein
MGMGKESLRLEDLRFPDTGPCVPPSSDLPVASNSCGGCPGRHASLALAHVPLQIFRHFSISCHIHPDRVSASRAFRFLYGFVCRTGFIICRVAQSSRCSVSGVLLGYEVLHSYYRHLRIRECVRFDII